MHTQYGCLNNGIDDIVFKLKHVPRNCNNGVHLIGFAFDCDELIFVQRRIFFTFLHTSMHVL